MEQVIAGETRKSGQEVAKQKRPSYGKTDVRYWEPRLFHASYTRAGKPCEVKDWCVRITHKKRREVFNLKTANKSAAASKAKGIYLMLLSEGWVATVAKYKDKSPEEQRKVDCTVGEFLSELKAISGMKPKTYADYAKSFRQIVAGIHGIESDKSKFDPHGGGREKWLSKVDSKKLASITPAKVQKWKLEFLNKRGTTPDKERTAQNSVNSIMRQAKTLFSHKHTKFLNMELPSPLPFDEVEFCPRQSMRYYSRIDVEKIVQSAFSELGQGDAEQQEQFKVFLLAVMAGLRRNEIDKLEWSAFDFNEGIIRIEATEFFLPKSEDSLGEIDLDEEIVSIFRGMRAKAGEGFVVASSVSPRLGASYTSYRCDKVFKGLIRWLRSNGVTARKPIHELRKEFGSLIAKTEGIFAASRALRHADIAITSQHYLDKKKRVSVGLGKLLRSEPSEVVEFSASDDTQNEKAYANVQK